MSKKIITIVFITLFSILLWVFISLSGEYFYNINLPIAFSDIPQGYAVSNYSDDEISISMKGQGWQLAQMTLGSNPEFLVPVSDQPGTHSVSLRNALEQNRWLSSTVQINEFSPTQVRYQLEEISKKKVPVNSNVSLEFKEGYGLISDIEVDPDSVIISGPKSIIEEIGLVNTKEKIYTEVDNSRVETIELEALNDIELNEDKVKINFNVQKIVDKEFKEIPVKIVNVPPSKNLTVYPETISVILKGGINVLGKLDKNEISVSVNFNQAIRDTLGYIVPNVKVPNFTKFVDTQPNRLEYIIQQL